jgi:hypothetical protein
MSGHVREAIGASLRRLLRTSRLCESSKGAQPFRIEWAGMGWTRAPRAWPVSKCEAFKFCLPSLLSSFAISTVKLTVRRLGPASSRFHARNHGAQT